MKYLFLILFILQNGCVRHIQVGIDEEKGNHQKMTNNKYIIIFENYFNDTISVEYKKKIVFESFVNTNIRLGVSEKYCTIDSVTKGYRVKLKINNKLYSFEPLIEYRYYYLSKSGKKLGVVYSDLQREYH